MAEYYKVASWHCKGCAHQAPECPVHRLMESGGLSADEGISGMRKYLMRQGVIGKVSEILTTFIEGKRIQGPDEEIKYFTASINPDDCADPNDPGILTVQKITTLDKPIGRDS